MLLGNELCVYFLNGVKKLNGYTYCSFSIIFRLKKDLYITDVILYLRWNIYKYNVNIYDKALFLRI